MSQFFYNFVGNDNKGVGNICVQQGNNGVQVNTFTYAKPNLTKEQKIEIVKAKIEKKKQKLARLYEKLSDLEKS
nr:hypothetical protein K-LCC10_0128 [Kaumoebavirus]